MKRSLLALPLLLAVLALLPQSTHAQDAASETYLQQADTEPVFAQSAESIFEGLLNDERALFDQFLSDPAGQSGSFALVRQQGTNLDAFVQQDGTRNAAILLQEGSSFSTSVLQLGEGHLYAGRLVGDEGTVRVLQSGTSNTYLMDLEGTALSHEVVQDGAGLRVVQTGVTSTPYSVAQRGSDQTITIQHNGSR